MVPAEGWAPRFSAHKHAATPIYKSRAEPCRGDSELRHAEAENRSKNGDSVEVIVRPRSVTNLDARRVPVTLRRFGGACRPRDARGNRPLMVAAPIRAPTGRGCLTGSIFIIR